MADERDTWNEWRNHVLKTLDENHKIFVKITEDHQKLAIELATMKAKITAYATLGAAGATILLNFLIKKMA